jgi:hypothetical protein
MELSKRSKYRLEAVNRRKSSSASHLRSPAQGSDVCDRSRTAAPALVAAFSSSTAWLKELRTSLSTRWLEVGGHPSVGPGDTLATRGAAEAVSKELGERAECPQRSGGSPSTDPPCPAFDTLSQLTRGAGRSAAAGRSGSTDSASERHPDRHIICCAGDRRNIPVHAAASHDTYRASASGVCGGSGIRRELRWPVK